MFYGWSYYLVNAGVLGYFLLFVSWLQAIRRTQLAFHFPTKIAAVAVALCSLFLMSVLSWTGCGVINSRLGYNKCSQQSFVSPTLPSPPRPVDFVRLVTNWEGNDSYNVLIPDLMKGDIVEVLAVSEGRYPPQWQPPHRTGWVRVKKGYVSVWVPDYILVNVPRSAERKRGKAQKPPSAKKKAPKKAQKKAVVKNGKPNPANMKKVEKKLESRNMRDTSPSPTLS